MDPRKEETDQKTEFKTFFLKIGNLTKNWGNRPKKRKPINKLRIWNFFWKPETDQKKGNLSTNWEFKTLFENRKRTQKWGNCSTNWEFETFLKIGKRPKKRGNRSTNWEFKAFFENWKWTQKNGETDLKKRKPINKLSIWIFFWKPETDPKKRKPINKLRIKNFYWKSEMDPKKKGKGPKKEETDQQTESLKLFQRTRNWVTDPKKKRKQTQKKTGNK